MTSAVRFCYRPPLAQLRALLPLLLAVCACVPAAEEIDVPGVMLNRADRRSNEPLPAQQPATRVIPADELPPLIPPEKSGTEPTAAPATQARASSAATEAATELNSSLPPIPAPASNETAARLPVPDASAPAEMPSKGVIPPLPVVKREMDWAVPASAGKKAVPLSSADTGAEPAVAIPSSTELSAQQAKAAPSGSLPSAPAAAALPATSALPPAPAPRATANPTKPTISQPRIPLPDAPESVQKTVRSPARPMPEIPAPEAPESASPAHAPASATSSSARLTTGSNHDAATRSLPDAPEHRPTAAPSATRAPATVSRELPEAPQERLNAPRPAAITAPSHAAPATAGLPDATDLDRLKAPESAIATPTAPSAPHATLSAPLPEADDQRPLTPTPIAMPAITPSAPSAPSTPMAATDAAPLPSAEELRRPETVAPLTAPAPVPTLDVPAIPPITAPITTPEPISAPAVLRQPEQFSPIPSPAPLQEAMSSTVAPATNAIPAPPGSLAPKAEEGPDTLLQALPSAPEPGL